MFTPIVQIVADNDGARAAALAELDKLVDDMPHDAPPNFAREGWTRSPDGTPIYIIRVPAHTDGEGNTGGRKVIRATGTRGRHLPPRVSELTDADLQAQRAARAERHARRNLAPPATTTGRKRKADGNLGRDGNASDTGAKRAHTISPAWTVTHTTEVTTHSSPWTEFRAPRPGMVFASPEHIQRERMSAQPQVDLLPPTVLEEDSKEWVKAAAEELAMQDMMLD